jgi:CubicO group peptidase (beta-lactamase class C family)
MTRKVLSIGALIVACSLIGSAQTSPARTSPRLPVAQPEEVGMSSERLARVGAMQRYVERGEVAGLVTLVARRGRIVHFESVGQRDAERKSPMTTDAIFRIASMTKPIASVAAMMLYEEGHFQLSDPISKWLPEFRT